MKAQPGRCVQVSGDERRSTVDKIRVILALVLGHMLLCCIALPSRCAPQPRKPQPGEWRCPPLPETFQISDLNGMWRAEYGAATDTLILREDRTYKQVYVRHSDGYSFESSWNRWWLERRPSGGLYLHLEGMRRCDQIDELCYQEGGGGGDWLYWDFCEDRRVEMNGEVVLMVTGVPQDHEPAPRGIWLWHMAPSIDSGSFHFVLQEEKPQ